MLKPSVLWRLIRGRLHRINIYEPLEIITQDEIDNHKNTEKEEKAEKTPLKTKNCENQKARKEPTAGAQPIVKLPEAQFKVIDDYIKPSKISQRQNSYYRYIENQLKNLMKKWSMIWMKRTMLGWKS